MLGDKLNNIGQNVKHIWEKMEEKETVEIIHWFSDTPYEDDLNRIAESRFSDICKWLLKHKTYNGWNQSAESSIFWLHGIR